MIEVPDSPFPNVRFLPVTSANIAMVGYDPDSGELVIIFRGTNSTSSYSYSDVPADVAVRLVFADSTGSAFARLVKGSEFKYRRHSEKEHADLLNHLVAKNKARTEAAKELG